MLIEHLQCDRKMFLKTAGTRGELHDIERVRIDLDRAYVQRAREVYLARYVEREIVRSPASLKEAIGAGPRIIIDSTTTADNVQSRIQMMQRVEPRTGTGVPAYVPVMFVPNSKITQGDKLLLAFQALAVSSVLGALPIEGWLVHGQEYKRLRVKVEPLVGRVHELIARIAADLGKRDPPTLTLNDHCHECEFLAVCRRAAEATDDLSLLRGLSRKEVEKFRGRGIATVTQLSRTYRPGARGKRKPEKKRKHDLALQALALRERKVFVVDQPQMPVPRVALYLDVEGVPDQDFDYLLGLLAVEEGRSTSYFFWADDISQEKAAWNACSQLIGTFSEYTLYHYGQYERRFLERMKKRSHGTEAAAIDEVLNKSCNVLSSIYSHIYFPTYSNSLKDIAGLLGYTWSVEGASGIQAIAWRLTWERGKEESLKQKLLLYNQEDCLALQRLTEFVLSVSEGAVRQTGETGPAVASATDLQSAEGRHFGKTKFFCPELDHINKCAYSDYQREKVYIRSSPAVRKSLRRKERASGKSLKVDQEVKFPSPEVCPDCAGREIQKIKGTDARKLVTDLKFTRSGVKRWCVRYRSARYRCLQCGRPLLAAAYRALRSHLGSNLCSLATYHHVALRQSAADVAMSLNDLFGFSFDRAILPQIIAPMATRHRVTYERLKDKLRHGALIHADETKALVKGNSGYVWAFTNLEEVVYSYTPTREGTILEDLLDGFGGVLVSDFYSAYDGVKCPQQKCLIHLLRDVNDDLFHNPFDEGLKQVAQQLVGVLKPIIDTIDSHGLRHRFLHKHKDDADGFLRYLAGQRFQSELAQKYQTRVGRYRDKLFTFLDHDGVPWNNNNAEVAVKVFASRRRIMGASFSSKGLQDYLVLLSIYQTCRNKNVSLLRFLHSGLLDLDAFADKRQ